MPSWGSARDVFETILPALYSQRAKRLVTKSKAQAVAGITRDAGAKTPLAKPVPESHFKAILGLPHERLRM